MDTNRHHDMIRKMVADLAADEVPVSMIVEMLDNIIMISRAVKAEVTGIPSAMGMSNERYDRIRSIMRDAIDVRLHPNTVPAAADRLVADIYDVIEETK